MININECGLATGSMVDACVVEVFKVVSKSSPEVTIEAEGRDPYYKGQWMVPSEQEAALIQDLLRVSRMMHEVAIDQGR